MSDRHEGKVPLEGLLEALGGGCVIDMEVLDKLVDLLRLGRLIRNNISKEGVEDAIREKVEQFTGNKSDRSSKEPLDAGPDLGFLLTIWWVYRLSTLLSDLEGGDGSIIKSTREEVVKLIETAIKDQIERN